MTFNETTVVVKMSPSDEQLNQVPSWMAGAEAAPQAPFQKLSDKIRSPGVELAVTGRLNFTSKTPRAQADLGFSSQARKSSRKGIIIKSRRRLSSSTQNDFGSHIKLRVGRITSVKRMLISGQSQKENKSDDCSTSTTPKNSIPARAPQVTAALCLQLPPLDLSQFRIVQCHSGMGRGSTKTSRSR
ncbi:hypothetical protein MJO28_012376 [Puccinia striiformis f. sp. tritici]|uniref:Uncharacterized protein n=4 Tax=Puccinia striiformis TaxID=27350 RepID=A0A0L0UX24_9BASI|nr:hypothetical protein MJO28_012376 [Puccinia striiformis f. sp. tritici]KAI7945663.1 hypothetical protein MJO29_012051 [Puccinia striiformis f. sp. tritici]KNE91597.1 hypothetical protein PSTG_14993 [Puccinia striiformis f. sp. tritici PST-78]POW17548.1 hypothetical protein PSTT_00488 [Puccinia striiformis]POW20593.1 hypothetical protein PSHT_03358 [Puccinia striiformis]